MIEDHKKEFSEIFPSFGLRLSEIILTPYDENSTPFTKVSIFPKEITQKCKIVNHLIGKDMTQLSNRLYCLQRNALIGVQKISNIKCVLKFQN